MDVEHRLRRLEDRAELQDLVVRYFLASDDDDAAALGECFVSDASFSVSGALCGDSREAILAFIASERAKMGLTVHTPNYALFTFTDDKQATGLVGAHLELVLGGQSLFGAVRYRDSYVRHDGHWRLRSRDMRVAHIAPWAEVGQALQSPTPVRWPGLQPLASDFPRKRG
jgi:hypothetical protein